MKPTTSGEEKMIDTILAVVATVALLVALIKNKKLQDEVQLLEMRVKGYKVTLELSQHIINKQVNEIKELEGHSCPPKPSGQWDTQYESPEGWERCF